MAKNYNNNRQRCHQHISVAAAATTPSNRSQVQSYQDERLIFIFFYSMADGAIIITIYNENLIIAVVWSVLENVYNSYIIQTCKRAIDIKFLGELTHMRTVIKFGISE
ncbi:hypothetical protein DERF_006069 [Dermatophagoides farinae]|uniref:Uncharacterized protein n=1 Tax=Dermatophagoides farinae TaxID=6954 RepID=A0A922L7T5_DERFA|nr:hypothetical protein DERF_006069 [Dermatophagoides farinae]